MVGSSAAPLSPAAAEDGGDESGGSESGVVAILLLMVAFVAGALFRDAFVGGTGFLGRLPYTVSVYVFGLLLGVLNYVVTDEGLGTLSDSIGVWVNISPELFLYTFLPALIFRDAYFIETHTFGKVVRTCLVLAGPAVLAGTGMLACVVKYVFPYGFSWTLSFAFAALLSATDPVAVVAIMGDVGASPCLNMVIEGEALLNDGTAAVLFFLFFDYATGLDVRGAGEVAGYVFLNVLGAPALGVAFGAAGTVWLSSPVFHRFDSTVQIAVTICVAYLSYFVADFTVGTSGLLCCLFAGLVMGRYGRFSVVGSSEEAMRAVWHVIEWLANTIVFALSGLITASTFRASGDAADGGVGSTYRPDGTDVFCMFALYVAIFLVRFLAIFALYPLLQWRGLGAERLNFREALFATWGGLRGAVGLALAIAVSRVPRDGQGISAADADRVLFLTGGVVSLTLLFNATTAQALLVRLGLADEPPIKAQLRLENRRAIRRRLLDALEAAEAGDEDGTRAPLLCVAQRDVVVQKVTALRPDAVAATAPPRPGAQAAPVEFTDAELARELRDRFLHAARGVYRKMLAQKLIPRRVAMALFAAVDEALDADAGLDWDAGNLRRFCRVKHGRRHRGWVWFDTHVGSWLGLLGLDVDATALVLGTYFASSVLLAHAHVRHEQFLNLEASATPYPPRDTETMDSRTSAVGHESMLTLPRTHRAQELKDALRSRLKAEREAREAVEAGGGLGKDDLAPPGGGKRGSAGEDAAASSAASSAVSAAAAGGDPTERRLWRDMMVLHAASTTCCDEATRFLLHVRRSHPRVLQSCKNRHAIYAILHREEELVDALEATGQLGPAEARDLRAQIGRDVSSVPAVNWREWG